MQVESLHPGVDLDTVRENTGFYLPVIRGLAQTHAPTATELRLLRDEVDPRGLIIGR